MLRRLLIILEMIKFEHTLFALPFALVAALLAVRGLPGWGQLGWLLLAMVGARSSAMTFNRLADMEYDRRNPRTERRALPAGLITTAQAWLFTLLTAGLLVLAAAMLNPLACYLSPLALAVIWGYSFTKRFTRYSHLVLGLALAVICWTAGFDIIYACQDVEFDRNVGLHSLPAKVGLAPALAISSLLHGAAFALLVAAGYVAHLGYGYGLALLPVAVLLLVQHRMVTPTDLSRANAAFFTANGLISLVLLAGTAVDVLILHIKP